MENILNTQNGIIGAVIMMALHLVVNVGKFIWDIYKEKSKSKDDALNANTAAILKLQKDLNRYYMGLKFVAGDKWQEARNFLDEEKT